MRAAVRLYVRIFLIVTLASSLWMGVFGGIAFTGAMWLVEGKPNAFELGWKSGLAMALLCAPIIGLVTAAFCGTLQLWRVVKLDLGVSEETLKVTQTRTLTIEQPAEEVFEMCRCAVAEIPRSRIIALDRATGEILAGIPWTAIRINLHIENNGAEHSKVTITSSPRLWGFLVTTISLANTHSIVVGGANLRNVQTIAVYLHRHCKVSDLDS